jgi:hypothetical protein
VKGEEDTRRRRKSRRRWCGARGRMIENVNEQMTTLRRKQNRTG